MLIFKWVRAVESKDWVENKRILWYTKSEASLVKHILQDFDITIISIWEMSDEIAWNMYEFWLSKEDKSINIIIAIEGKIRDAFKSFCEDFWIRWLDYVKPYGVEMEQEKIDLVLKKLSEEFYWDKPDEKKEKNKEIDIHKISQSDKKKLDAFKVEVNDFVNEINEMLPKAESSDPNLAIDLRNELWNLMKYKSTTNIFKLADHYKKALEISEKLYKAYYSQEKTKESSSQSEHVISEIDIVAEYENFKKVQRSKSLEKVSSKDFWTERYKTIFYKIFGKFWINIKLMSKELQTKYKLNYLGTEDVFKFIQFVLIFLIINYSFLLVYNIIINQDNNAARFSIYYMLLNIAIFWFIVTLWKILNNKLWLIISIIIMFIIYFAFGFVKRYFWL